VLKALRILCFTHSTFGNAQTQTSSLIHPHVKKSVTMNQVNILAKGLSSACHSMIRVLMIDKSCVVAVLDLASTCLGTANDQNT